MTTKKTRRRVVRKKVSRKKTPRRVVRKKVSRKKSRVWNVSTTGPAPAVRKKVRRREPGYSQTSAGVYAPDDLVQPGKLRKGMKSATKKLEAIVSDLAAIDGDGYAISEVEVSASFDVNGKFLGYGVGGDVSVKLRLRPE